MRNFLMCLFVLLGVQVAQADCTLAVTLDSTISASTSDYLERAEKRAHDKGCAGIFVRVNTPGGSLQSTRLIVEKILDSKIPYLCLITPSGGHAGSAGAIILQACHVNGGLHATNIGAATPIMGTGEKISDDLRKKVINDTVSWLEGVTQLRGRNVKFSREIVVDAKAIGSEEAHKIGALDILAATEKEFLEKANERKVRIKSGQETQTKIYELSEFPPVFSF